MKEIYKIVMPYLIIGILIVIASFIMKGCERKPIKPTDQTLLISSLTNRIEHLTSEITHVKIDTLKIIKIRYKTKYDTTYIEITKQAPDTCGYYLAKLNNECLILDSINNAIISEQESQMIKYSEVVGLMQERNDAQEKRHVKDSVEINTLTKKLTRTRKIAAIGIGAAFIGGLIIK
jgi:hypothetical protein